jgi:hypothetical protein
MNWRRGLFRIWIVSSFAWIVVAGYMDDLPCTFGVRFSAPWCIGYAHDPYAWESAWPIHVLVFGVPVGALVIGVAIVWTIKGFNTAA